MNAAADRGRMTPSDVDYDSTIQIFTTFLLFISKVEKGLH